MDVYDISTYKKPQEQIPTSSHHFDEHYIGFDLTTVIGREYSSVDLQDVLASEDLVKELALIVSERGVVFFRDQSLNTQAQKTLVQKMGEAVGKPKTSSLHIHPLMNDALEENRGLQDGADDPEISVISSQHGAKRYKDRFATPPGRSSVKPPAVRFWHNDTSFEEVPSDYTSLKVIDTPSVGGDTLWASGYEMYDRLSSPVQSFLEGLTATFHQPLYKETARVNKFRLYVGPRGSPLNTNMNFTAVHPVVRTNPVTGRRSIFAFGQHCSHINQVSETESAWILDMIRRTLTENHDLQVRFRWTKNAVAIWDNRSVFHTATYDHDGPRVGVRTVAIGERPYLAT